MTPDSRSIISGDQQDALRQGDWTLEGHKRPVAALIGAPGERFMISGSADATLKYWDIDWELQTNRSIT